MDDATGLLAPQQLGYGVSGGAEAAVHDSTLVNFRITMPWSGLIRDKMLEAMEGLVPSIYPFVHSVYSSPYSLFGG